MPLVNTFPPYDQELLLSLLYRLSHLNYNDPRHILPTYIQSDILDQKRIADSVITPRLPQTFEVLSDLTTLDQSTLWQGTIHTFADVLTPPGQVTSQINFRSGKTHLLLDSRTLSRHLYSHLNVPYCPLCLAKSRYFRKYWLLIIVTCCLEHHCLLQKNCPKCSNAVTVHDVTFDECHTCGFRLSSNEPFTFKPDDFDIFSQQMIQSWFHLYDSPYQDVYQPCVESTSSSLYYFLYQLQSIVSDLVTPQSETAQKIENVWPIKKNETDILKIHIVVMQACQIFTRWPTEFFNFLDALRQNRSESHSYSSSMLSRDFGAFYRWLQKTAKLCEVEFVQTAFDEFVAQHYGKYFGVRRSDRLLLRPDIIERFEFITFTEASKILKVSAPAIKALQEAGFLNKYDSIDADYQTNEPHPLLKRSEVDEFDKKLSVSVTCEAASTQLGLSQAVTRELIRKGVIGAVRGPSVDGSQHWRISQGSILRFLYELHSWTIRLNKENTYEKENRLYFLGQQRYSTTPAYLLVDITTATKIVAPIGGNLVWIIQWILLGYLVPYTYERHPQLHSLYFKHSDIQQLIASYKQGRDWADREDIARIMHVKLTLVDRWIKHGLFTSIAKIGSKKYFSKRAIELFSKEHVTTYEAALILGTNELTVQKWARNGRLKPIVGHRVDGGHKYLFKRADIEFVARCITSGTVVEILGISRSTLGQWIRERKLAPVSGPGIDRCGNYHFEPQDIAKISLDAQEMIETLLAKKDAWFKMVNKMTRG